MQVDREETVYTAEDRNRDSWQRPETRREEKEERVWTGGQREQEGALAR